MDSAGLDLVYAIEMVYYRESRSFPVKRGLLKSLRKALFSCAALLSGIVLFIPGLPACTLWSAAGESVVGGGTLLAKNRDWIPDHQMRVELIPPGATGYGYLCLVAAGRGKAELKAGVNSEGLVYVTASPPSYLEKGKGILRFYGLGRRILAECKTVKEALSHEEWLVGPRFIMLADRHEVAVIEIGLDGKFLAQSTKSGALSHTNHYREPELDGLNRTRPGVSSVKRCERVQEFLKSKEKFELSDFVQMSASTEDGPDNSLWRTGSKPTSPRTLGTWIVHQPTSNEGCLYLKMANPGKEVKEYRFKLQDVFSGKVNVSGVE
jgi:hypothetical protein